MRLLEFDKDGRLCTDGVLYDINEVRTLLQYCIDDETKDDIIFNICKTFNIPISE